MPDEINENRINIEDLPQAEKELSPEEAEGVQGGVDGADFLKWQRQGKNLQADDVNADNEESVAGRALGTKLP